MKKFVLLLSLLITTSSFANSFTYDVMSYDQLTGVKVKFTFDGAFERGSELKAISVYALTKGQEKPLFYLDSKTIKAHLKITWISDTTVFIESTSSKHRIPTISSTPYFTHFMDAPIEPGNSYLLKGSSSVTNRSGFRLNATGTPDEDRFEIENMTYGEHSIFGALEYGRIF